MQMIYLTLEQAESIRGRYGEYSGLDPIETDDGMFSLPYEIMDNDEFKDALNKLKECKYSDCDYDKDTQKFKVKKISKVKIKDDDKNKPNY